MKNLIKRLVREKLTIFEDINVPIEVGDEILIMEAYHS